jgi:hypothetical protein
MGRLVMKKVILSAVAGAAALMPIEARSDCKIIHDYRGLVFDAGALALHEDMPSRLDLALMRGVEKVVLFDHVGQLKSQSPEDLEEQFPDLVLQAKQPWSGAEAVKWADVLVGQDGSLETLGDELSANPDQTYLLSHLSRFDLDVLKSLASNHPNLWLGFNAQDVKGLLSDCSKSKLDRFMREFSERIVFSSFGAPDDWKYYKYTIRNLRKLAGLWDENRAQKLLIKNAEQLYRVAVNAP